MIAEGVEHDEGFHQKARMVTSRNQPKDSLAMTKNSLYFGDNLDVLRGYINDESIDLVYLGPPFNSKADYR